MMWERIRNGDPMVIAGIGGSLFALIYTKNLTKGEALLTSVGGTCAAIFLSPVIASGLPDQFAPAISFLVGIFSMSMIGVVFEIINKIKESPVETISDIASIVINVLVAFKNGTDQRKEDPSDEN